VLDFRISGADDDPESSGEIVLDLTASLLANRFEVEARFSEPPIAVIAPLLPSGSRHPTLWPNIVSPLEKSSPAAILGVSPELSPVDRRRLVESLGEEFFDRVHHEPEPGLREERDFAHFVANLGMNPFFERPRVQGLSLRAERNRRIAAVLFEAGERWLALERGEADGASLLAAGRHVESATLEIEALARERQLALLPYLAPLARRTVEAFVAEGRSPLLTELRASWAGVEVHA
jgi:hypothetical protein